MSIRPKRKPEVFPRPGALRPVLCLVLGSFSFSCALLANPEGESVRHGRASFEREGNNLLIRQQDERIAVDWRSFSIAGGERTEFLQPSQNSSALNRVFGGTRSLINGELKANGQVILVNPAGITVGTGGAVNVNSFIGTTLDVTDDAFLAGGDLPFSGSSESDVINLGTIHAATGDVLLLAREVSNQGTISAPQGTVGIGAGTEIVVQPQAEEKLVITRGSSRGSKADVKGRIRAVTAEIKAAGNPYALAINLDGVIETRGTSSKPAGRVKIHAGSGNVKVTRAAAVSARNADGSGGSIAVNTPSLRTPAGAGDVEVEGLLDARGETGTGGMVALVGKNVTLRSGSRVDVSGATGGGLAFVGGDFVGGRSQARRYFGVDLPKAETVTFESGATIAANAPADAGDGGAVILSSEQITLSYGSVALNGGTAGGHGGSAQIVSDGSVMFDGLVEAIGSAGRGGSIALLGKNISLGLNSRLDASGRSGGGEMFVGGDFRGGLTPGRRTFPEPVQNAETLTVASGAVLKAGALRNGDGGTISLWATQTTLSNGSLRVGGGDRSGNGGIATIGGAGAVTLGGMVDATASGGVGGVVEILGDRVMLRSRASLDASGRSGGGKILAGGDYLGGKDPVKRFSADALPTASTLGVERGALLKADALVSGNGGTVIQWSDDITVTYGSVFARGGVRGGDGGFAEVSSAGFLRFDGSMDLSAPQGVAGDVFLDPAHLEIGTEPGSLDGSLPDILAGTGSGTQTVSVAALEAISAGSITLEATGSPGTDSLTYGIKVLNLRANDGDGSIDLQTDVSLSLLAENGVIQFVDWTNAIVASGSGEISIRAGTSPGAEGAVLNLGRLQTATGAITIDGADGVETRGAISTQNASVSLNGDSDADNDGNSYVRTYGTITVGGGGDLTLNARNANGGTPTIWIQAPITLNTSGFALSGTNASTGTYFLSSVVSMQGNFTLTEPVTISGRGGFSVTNHLTLASTVTLAANSSASLVLESETLSLSGAFVGPENGGVEIRSPNPARSFILLGSDGLGGAYDVDSGLFAQLLDFGSVSIGRLDGTGTFSVAAELTTTKPLKLQAAGVGGTLSLGSYGINGTSGAPLIAQFDVLSFGGTGALSSQATGNAVVISANHLFNSRGADALQTPNGRWLAYIGDPFSSTFGGLASGNTALWSRTIGNAPPSTVAHTGNRFLFATQPVLIYSATSLTKTYGDTLSLPTPTYVSGLSANTFDGAVLADTAPVVLADDPSAFSAGTSALTSVGNYAIGLTRGQSMITAGYGIALQVPSSVTVTARPITVTALGGTSVYGDSPSNPGLSATNLANGQTASVLSGLSNSFNIVNTTGAGQVATAVSGILTNANYDVTGLVGGTWTVTPKDITVTAGGGVSTYGASPTNPGFTASGLVNGEGVGVLSGLQNDLTLTNLSGVGTYDVQVTGVLSNNNYQVTSRTDSPWTILPTAIVIEANGGSSVYGDSPANPGFQAIGLVNGETQSVLTGLSTNFDITNLTDVGQYTLGLTGTLLNPNYFVAFATTSTWEVTPKRISITAPQGTSIYGNSPTNPGISAVGLVNGQTSGVLTGLTTEFGVTNLTPAGAYVTSISGRLTNGNYAIDSTSTGVWTVGRRGISLSANGGSSVYGDSPTSPGFSAVGLANGENASVLTGLSTSFGVTSLSSAGSYATTLKGNLANANYEVMSKSDGVWIVAPKELTLTARGGGSTYGESPLNPGFTASGLVNGETEGVLTGLSNSFGIDNLSAAGAYQLRVAGALANANYTIASQAPATWTVQPKAVTVFGLGGSSVFGSVAANPGLAAEGLVNGETVTVLTGLSNSFGITTQTSAGIYQMTVAGQLSNPNYTLAASIAGTWTVTAAPLAPEAPVPDPIAVEPTVPTAEPSPAVEPQILAVADIIKANETPLDSINVTSIAVIPQNSNSGSSAALVVEASSASSETSGSEAAATSSSATGETTTASNTTSSSSGSLAAGAATAAGAAAVAGSDSGGGAASSESTASGDSSSTTASSDSSSSSSGTAGGLGSVAAPAGLGSGSPDFARVEKIGLTVGEESGEPERSSNSQFAAGRGTLRLGPVVPNTPEEVQANDDQTMQIAILTLLVTVSTALAMPAAASSAGSAAASGSGPSKPL